jgi:hypothetical protein
MPERLAPYLGLGLGTCCQFFPFQCKMKGAEEKIGLGT